MIKDLVWGLSKRLSKVLLVCITLANYSVAQASPECFADDSKILPASQASVTKLSVGNFSHTIKSLGTVRPAAFKAIREAEMRHFPATVSAKERALSLREFPLQRLPTDRNTPVILLTASNSEDVFESVIVILTCNHTLYRSRVTWTPINSTHEGPIDEREKIQTLLKQLRELQII